MRCKPTARSALPLSPAGNRAPAAATPPPLGAPPSQATIVPRGHALGMVSQVPEKDEYSVTRQQMRAQIDVCMGGKAAEELIFGGWAWGRGRRWTEVGAWVAVRAGALFGRGGAGAARRGCLVPPALARAAARPRTRPPTFCPQARTT